MGRIDARIAELRSLFHWRPHWDCCHTPEAPTKAPEISAKEWRWRKSQGEYGLLTPAAKESPKPRKRKVWAAGRRAIGVATNKR